MNLFLPGFSTLVGLLLAPAMLASEGAAGPDQAICGTSTVMAADALAAGESGFWAVVSGSAVFTDSHAPLSQVTGLSPGDNVLQWTVVGNGPVVIDQVIITVYDPAATVANAGPDSVLCLPADEMDLLATPPVYPAMGSWSSVGIALIDVFTDPHSSATFPAQGSVQLIWTVFNGTCGQVSDTAVVSVQECVIGVPELADRQRTTCWFDASSKVLSVRNASARESVELIDQNGRVVQRSVLKAVNDNRIDLSGVRPGFYTAKVVTVGQAGVLRFVIDH